MKKSYLPYFILIFLFLGTKSSSFGNIIYSKPPVAAAPMKQTATRCTPPVEKKKAKKKRRRKAKKERYQLRHKPDRAHSPWPWIALAWTVIGIILLIIGLALGIYLLWFIAFIALVALPAVFFFYMIIAVLA